MGWTYTKALLGASSSSSSTTKTATRGRPKKQPNTSPRTPNRARSMPASNTLPSIPNRAHDDVTTIRSASPSISNTTSTKLPNPANARFSSSPVIKNRESSIESTSSSKKMLVRDMYENLLPPNKSNYHSGSSTASTDSIPLSQLLRPQSNVNAKDITTSDETAKPKKRGRTPNTTTVQRRKRTTDEARSETSKKIMKRQSLPILDAIYQLKLVIKGHTEINIPVREKGDLEDSKDIWCCEFEPIRHSDDISTQTVAIAGSYSVLFLDTEQGRYIKKYTHSEMQEVFYCMSWTTLQGKELLNEQATEDDPGCNILAVAGRLGSIKLLNPLQNECYRYLFGHRKAVLALTFAKAEPRWLFSASADRTVRLWDIGSPTSKTDDSACLARFNIPQRLGNPTSISISHDLSTLMVGCDNGDLIRYTITKRHIQAFKAKTQEFRDKEASENGDKWASGGAIASLSPMTVYPTGDEWHEGYLDDICILGQDGNEKHHLYNKIVSRASDDMEIIIWDPKKSTKDDASIDISLEWPESAECTGLKYKVIEKGNI
ncbi:WD40-repeat-containing domain protein [Cokeromyces recurvatus]|uniref:WD40-repeat-containing domain protein n=1 Tax=Cokeromyces recurvatus TaxID=90255 RepID=UPI00222062A5|nr:WD40-repeat-containing domain protein [Cokeromyces recurvatus]KAI7898927.1 WD40-repeat-containing domain protein [Cokeromyces recurvatus]